MNYSVIDYAIDQDVAVIRLNRPDALNAIDATLAAELLDALERGVHEARAILLGGVGRAFCSGADLTGGGFDMADPRRDVGSQLDVALNPVVRAMRAAPVPIVTAVRGAAAGIGCAIALAGDLIVAGEGAYFLQAFRHIGLVPDGGSTYLLSRAIGRTRAMEMMLLGPKLPAAKALDWGLINRVVADDDVDTAAMALAGELARGPRSLGLIKQAAWAALDQSFETVLANERAVQREAGRTEDFGEGVAAFREKRPARFSGR